jgi:hypothetical protein
MDTAQAALREAQAAQAGQAHCRLPPKPGCAGAARLAVGGVGQRLVAQGWQSASIGGHDNRLVQGARAREPDGQVCCVETIEETAGCDIARPVVWEDGGREAPSYPIGTLVACPRVSGGHGAAVPAPKLTKSAFAQIMNPAHAGW